MKLVLTSLVITLFWSLSLVKAEEPVTGGAVTQKILDSRTNKENKEEFYTEQQVYKDAVEKCKGADPDNQGSDEQLNECIQIFLAKEQKSRGAIDTILKSDQKTPGAKEGVNPKKAPINLYTDDKFKIESPYLMKLKEFLSKRMEKFLYGAEGIKSKKVVGQEIFFKLHKSQLGKNIISTITSFCIDIDYNSDPLEISSTPAETRKTNIKALESPTKQTDPKTKKEKVSVKAYDNYEKCIKNIRPLCHGEDASGETKRRACVVLNNLKKLRNSLNATEKIQKEFDKLRETDDKVSSYNASEIFLETKEKQAKKLYLGTKETGDKNIEEITTVTSKDILYGEESDNLSKDLTQREKAIDEQCKNPTSEACLKLLGNEKEDEKRQEKLQEEYTAKSNIMAAKISSFDEDELRAYYKSQGRTDEEIDKIFKQIKEDQGKTFEEIIKEIKTEYLTERKSIIEEMKSKLKSRKTAELNEKDEIKGNTNTVDNIKEGLEKADDYKQVIHFSNIISGYLELEDSDGNSKGRNTTSMQLELGQSAYGINDGSEGGDIKAQNEQVHLQNINKLGHGETGGTLSDDTTHGAFSVSELTRIFETKIIKDPPDPDNQQGPDVE